MESVKDNYGCGAQEQKQKGKTQDQCGPPEKRATKGKARTAPRTVAARAAPAARGGALATASQGRADGQARIAAGTTQVTARAARAYQAHPASAPTIQPSKLDNDLGNDADSNSDSKPGNGPDSNTYHGLDSDLSNHQDWLMRNLTSFYVGMAMDICYKIVTWTEGPTQRYRAKEGG